MYVCRTVEIGTKPELKHPDTAPRIYQTSSSLKAGCMHPVPARKPGVCAQITQSSRSGPVAHLKDIEHELGVAYTSRVPRSIIEINKERELFDAGRHHIDAPLEYPHGKLHLPRRLVRIVPMRVHVMQRTSLVIETHHRLLAALRFGLDRLRAQIVHPELTTPDERGFQALFGAGQIPFRRAQVPQETFPGEQPQFLPLASRFALRARFGMYGEIFGILEMGDHLVQFALLIGLERGRWGGLAARIGRLEDAFVGEQLAVLACRVLAHLL